MKEERTRLNRGKIHDLSGQWHISSVTNELRRTGADPDLDHRLWSTVPVPGHWASSLGPESGHGPFVYRHRFSTPESVVNDDESSRYWVGFDGVMGGAEIWFDGRFLGDINGYFARRRFEITRQLKAKTDHLLALDVACPPGGGPWADNRANMSLTGALQTGPFASQLSPGGIWRPVTIQATGPVAIRHARVLCTSANQDKATLQIRLVLDSAEPTEATVHIDVGQRGQIATESVTTNSLAAGENRLEWELAVDNPDLWWPASLGQQPLYDLNVSVRHEGFESDGRSWKTGLRRVEMKNFIWRINGQRMFMKSIAYGPTTPFLGDMTSDRLTGDVELVRQAGFDMMRLFAHVNRPEIYTAGDRLGVLLWQDLPLIGGYSSKVRRAAKILIQEAVDQLGHHPSVVNWGGHVLPNGDAVELPTEDKQEQPRAIVKRFAQHITPTWNRGVLDSIVGRELKRADKTRPVVTRSASLPSPTEPAGSDAFLWFGWRIGLPNDFADLVRRWPRLAAFPGGIGSQSVSIADWGIDAPSWPAAERTAFDRYLPRRAYPDGRSWARATRAYQADLLVTHIQTLRRLKYRPTGGFCLFALVDNHPEGGFGIVDLERRPKPAWNRVFEACRPVVVLLEPLPTTVVPGETIQVSLHIVNDLAVELHDAKVVAELFVESDDGGRTVVQRRGWASTIAADSCEKVSSLRFAAPDAVGPLSVEISLTTMHLGIPLRTSTSYRTIVIPAAEALKK